MTRTHRIEFIVFKEILVSLPKILNEKFSALLSEYLLLVSWAAEGGWDKSVYLETCSPNVWFRCSD